MANYYLTRKAVEDLNKIWYYTFQNWSEEQADRYYHFLLDSCQYIADNPTLGKSYDLIRPDLYGIKANRHIIFYRKLSSDKLEITRILHGRMDLKNRFTEQ
ncbi:type II toxin-antitoxin system RelE/ParE family toxin [Salinimicrobium catena]|uniref:type II toxin-antitoxin system RelE/ParE family toxin n=1 Tax=Salinimicrobium catena TaxID=390640 RepID=UPI002FE48860